MIFEDQGVGTKIRPLFIFYVNVASRGYEFWKMLYMYYDYFYRLEARIKVLTGDTTVSDQIYKILTFMSQLSAWVKYF